jgi:hypothetical protein
MTATTTPLSVTREIVLRFRKNKETGTKRENIVLQAPVPNEYGLIEILKGKSEDPKLAAQYELLMDAMESYVFTAAQNVAEDTSIVAENFPMEKISWEAIALQPKADRRVAITAEQWRSWVVDYMRLMPILTDKTIAQCKLAVDVFTRKCVQARGDKKSLSTLKDLLAVFATSEAGEQHEEIISLLDRKLDALLLEVTATDLGGL